MRQNDFFFTSHKVVSCKIVEEKLKIEKYEYSVIYNEQKNF